MRKGQRAVGLLEKKGPTDWKDCYKTDTGSFLSPQTGSKEVPVQGGRFGLC